MKKFYDTVEAGNGSLLAGAQVRVLNKADDSLATIYSDFSGTPLANPVTTDSLGFFEFYTADGDYNLEYLYAGLVVKRLKDIPIYRQGPSGVVTSATGQTVANRGLLAAIVTPANGQIANLSETGREGAFLYSTANNATNVTSDPGQGIYVAAAGDATGASGAWVRIYTGALSVKWFGALGDNATDDTTAIQRAINYACTLNVAKLFFPAGRYVVTNLSLPALANTAASMKVIEFVGVAQPSSIFGTVIGATVVSQSGSIIRSTATSGAIIGVTASAGSFSFYHLVVHDLNIRAADNPQVAWIDAGWAIQFSAYNLQLDTGTYNMNASLPTHAGAIGIVTPKTGNGALTYLRNIVFNGCYIGLDVNEHTNGDCLSFNSCLYAMRFQTGNEACFFGRVLAQYCPTVIAVNGTCRFEIKQLTIEHAAGDILIGPTSWMAPIEDIRDVSSTAHASIGIDLSAHNIGVQTLDNLTFNGGTHIHVYPSGDPGNNAGFHIIANPSSIPNNVATNLTWASGSDGDSGLQIDTDTTHLKCVVPGLYEIAFRGAFASNATGNRKLLLGLNGTVSDEDIRPAMGSSLETAMLVHAIIPMVKGDYLTIAAFQDSGGALALQQNSYSGTMVHKRIGGGW